MTADAGGDVWEYAIELCRGLSDAGVQVVLAVMGPALDERQAATASYMSGVELHFAPFRLEWMQDPWKDVTSAGEWLLGLESRRHCDLVHLNGYAHGALPFRSPKLVVGHSCVLSWWRAVKGEAPPATWDRYRREVASGLHAADFVVAPTSWMLASLEENYGALARSDVIPNGRTVTAFGPGEKNPVILGGGRIWDEARNAAMVARVAGRLPWPVKIAGALAPATIADPIREAPALGAPESWAGATLLGEQSPAELAALYAEAAVYAMPARYEPFGLPIVEAALSECALVLADIPSLRELWTDAAVFVTPDDDGELEAALLMLMNQPELTALLAMQARRRAAAYSATKMRRRYLELYRRILAGRDAAGGQGDVRSSCVS